MDSKETTESVPAPRTGRQARFQGAVSTECIEQYLRLLAAFRDLRKHAAAFETVPPPYSESGATQASTSDQWPVLRIKALVRFEMYLTQVLPRAPNFRAPLLALAHLNLEWFAQKEPVFVDVPEAFLPPLDVALIWHTYMLNPSRFYEDVYLVDSRYVLGYFKFPLGRELGNPAASDTWEELTGTPAQLLSWETPGHPVDCPSCGTSTVFSWDQLAEGSWAAKCANCSFMITRGSVLGKRWKDDAERWALGGSDVHGWRMRGGVLSPKNGAFMQKDPFAPVLVRLFVNQRDTEKANHDMYGHPLLDTNVDIYGPICQGTGLPEALYSSFQDIDALGKEVLRLTRRTVDRGRATPNQKEILHEDILRRVSLLMRSYVGAHPLSEASLDLVQAMQRQFRFIETADELGWLDMPHKANPKNAQLRYYAWLALAWMHDEVFSPTLDIDLAWHTHQLDPAYYCNMFKMLGHFLDHDDTVEEDALSSAFEKSAVIWEHAYKQPYTVTGMVRPHSMVKKLFARGKGKAKETIADEVETATQPSQHNAVTVEGHDLRGMEPFHVTGTTEAPGHCISGPGATARGACISGKVKYKPA